MSALWITDRLCCEPLTNLVSMLPVRNKQRLREFARLLKSLAAGLDDLRAFYDKEGKTLDAPPTPDFHAEGGASCLPHQLRGYR